MKTQPSISVDWILRISLVLGLAGLAAGAAGGLGSSPQRFYQAYLVAFLFWLGLSLGSLALLLIHFLTGSRWGLALRRVHEAAASTLWLMAILIIPLLLNLKGLYPWTNPQAVQADSVLQQKSVYLNEPFFIARTVFYFVVWILLAFVLTRLSSRRSTGGEPEAKARLQGWGAFGLILYTVTMSFAAIDWMMSLEPFWNSTVYGLIVVIGQMLSGFAFSLLILFALPGQGAQRQWNFRSTPRAYKDLGGLLLTFVMGWAYLAYFQFLIIWAGNMPREVVWYAHRIQGGWLTLAILVGVAQFVLPFGMLLSLRVRNSLRVLAWLGALIALAYYANLYWEVMPAFSPEKFNPSWLDLALLVGVGGVWLGAFLFALKRRPVFSPEEREALQGSTKNETQSSLRNET